MEKITSYISQIELKVLNRRESEEFYNLLFEFLPLEKKEEYSGNVVYWGSFGLMISQQERFKQVIGHENRLGITAISVFVSQKSLIDSIFVKFRTSNYKIKQVPSAFDYAPGYYSLELLDPDDNIIKIFTTD